MLLGFLESRFVRPFQTHQPEQGRRVPCIQSQRSIRGIMPTPNGAVVIVALQSEASEEAMTLDGFAPFERFSRAGLVGRVDLVGSRL